jgi:hypothetical protein
MISLSDSQLKNVMAAVGALPIENRDVFLRRLAAMLQICCGLRRRYADTIVVEVTALAARGLMQGSARDLDQLSFPRT